MTSAPRHEAASAPAVPALPAVPQRERVFAFRDFVLRRFGPQIFTESARLPVLDVAGGKGDLSWLLKNADGLDAVVVDPRVTDHTKITRTALWHYQILCVAPSKLLLVTDAGFFFLRGLHMYTRKQNFAHICVSNIINHKLTRSEGVGILLPGSFSLLWYRIFSLTVLFHILDLGPGMRMQSPLLRHEGHRGHCVSWTCSLLFVVLDTCEFTWTV